jgi:hypothetical protein
MATHQRTSFTGRVVERATPRRHIPQIGQCRGRRRPSPLDQPGGPQDRDDLARAVTAPVDAVDDVAVGAGPVFAEPPQIVIAEQGVAFPADAALDVDPPGHRRWATPALAGVADEAGDCFFDFDFEVQMSEGSSSTVTGALPMDDAGRVSTTSAAVSAGATAASAS